MADVDDDMKDEPSLKHDEQAAPPRRWRRLPLLIAGTAVLTIIVVSVLALLAPPLGTMLRGGGPAEKAPSTDSYVEAPPMVVNMRDADGRSHFLKLRFVLVAARPRDVDAVQKQIPLIVDSLQSFLRGLRPEDMGGSAAVYRVKEEMMVRIRQTLGNDSVADVLIQDMIEQ